MSTADLLVEFVPPARAAAALGYLPPAPTHPVLCSCKGAGATGLDDLDHLVNVAGVDQLTASRSLWAPWLLDQPLETHEVWAARTVARQVRFWFDDVLTWLGLP